MQILGDFLCPLGSLGPPFWTQNDDFFRGLILSHFLDHFWEGPAAEGSWDLQKRQYQAGRVSSGPFTPGSPFGGAANPEASPLPPAPPATCWPVIGRTGSIGRSAGLADYWMAVEASPIAVEA